MDISPKKIVIFLSSTAILFLIVNLLIPEDGLKLFGQLIIRPIPFQTSLTSIEEINQTDSISPPIQSQAKVSYDELINNTFPLEMKDSIRNSLDSFFSALTNDSHIRIMHFGDSQLEGDRITAYLRNNLQTKFGGYGVGLISIKNVSQHHLSIISKQSKNWHRTTPMNIAKKDQRTSGLAINGSYSSCNNPNEGNLKQEIISIEANPNFYPRSGVFEKLRLFYHNPNGDILCKIETHDSILCHEKLLTGVEYATLLENLPESCKALTLTFSGKDQVLIYGIELASETGIIVDNIALRGSLGTFFTSTDYTLDKMMLNDLDPKLFILQFGTNMIQKLEKEEDLNDYISKFSSQIDFLQELRPNTSILIVGPSDLSIKQNGLLATPLGLPKLNEKMQKLALSKNCSYWNLYKAMGGRNSMISWVNAEPRLAVSDYTHFSPQGAKLVGNMLFNTLISEYERFCEKND